MTNLTRADYCRRADLGLSKHESHYGWFSECPECRPTFLKLLELHKHVLLAEFLRSQGLGPTNRPFWN